MSDTSSQDLSHPLLNLSAEEKRIFSHLFNQADSDKLGVVTGERAVSFFEPTHVSPNVLGDIWQLADTENRGLLTKPGFCVVLRLIGHYQAGREPRAELAFKPGPLPKFDGMQMPAASPTAASFPASTLQPQTSGGGAPIRVPPLQPDKVAQYSGIFANAGAQNGMLDGGTAKAIFERAGLPNEVLGRIWMLSDREQRGALDMTEFIVAMHLLTSYRTRAMTALPNVLPPGLYEAAARRGAPPPPGSRGGPRPIQPQFTVQSGSSQPRTQSPLARPPGYSTPPPQTAQPTGVPWLITPQEKAKYDQFFATVDPQGRGVITGEQAVKFFSDSGLDEDILASVWDLADINSEGQLNRDEFAVAMYLIRQQRSQPAGRGTLPAFLPQALVPPSMRKQPILPSQPTAPAFDNAANRSNMPKSASEDLFGLDQPSPPRPQQQAPMQALQTGGSSRDRSGGSQPASPSSPQRFQPQPQNPSSVFKPFMPSSAFGASIVAQTTGGSATSSQGQGRGVPVQQQRPQQPPAMDDLLGDNDAEETSKINSDTTELANMSNQIGNLRNQMQDTQTKKDTTQRDVTATQNQKRDLELRLQQFRRQYEQQVKAVKELETQLATSRTDSNNLQQQLAMLEGTYQDLQTQHQSVNQALQADQQENASLKQRISQLNQEVSTLRPQTERMRADARQQKGLVSINKKQLTTVEGERDKLQGEMSDLTQEAEEREAARRAAEEEAARSPPPTTRDEISPTPSTMSSTNPFFRKTSGDQSAAAGERAMSPAEFVAGAPSTSAFDALFGPSFAQQSHEQARTATPPVTSIGSRQGRTAIPPVASFGAAQQRSAPFGSERSGQSVSSEARPTPSATPPLSSKNGSPQNAEPPPPPESRQFTSQSLPVRDLPSRSASLASSTRVLPPASRAGGTETPKEIASPVPLTMSSPFAAPPAAAASSPLPEAAEPTSVPASEEGTGRDSIPGAFPEDAISPAGQLSDQTTRAEAPKEAPRDDFESAFSAFGRKPASENAKGADPLAPSSSQPEVVSVPKDDFESSFAGLGKEPIQESQRPADPFAPSSSQQPSTSRGVASEFPPIQTLEHEVEESDSEDEMHPGFEDNFAAGSPQRNGVAAATHGAAETAPEDGLLPNASVDEITDGRPTVRSIESTASDLPGINAQTSPPAYEQSEATNSGHGGPTGFPREFGGLLPSREDPTSPPPPVGSPPAQQLQDTERVHTPLASSQNPFPSEHTPVSTAGSDIYQDASSRPWSSVIDAGQTASQAQSATHPPGAKNAVDDDFDFGDLSEAQSADKSGDDFAFNSHSREGLDEFNPAFDSPTASMSNTMASSQQTPTARNMSSRDNSSGFNDFDHSISQAGSHPPGSAFGGTSSIQQTPQSTSHDWDAIFSGLDTPSNNNVDTSFGSVSSPFAKNTNFLQQRTAPKELEAPPSRSTGAPLGRALTPGTEHDDPILKRLTGMGYPRSDALNALETFDYDINKAVDLLTSK